MKIILDSDVDARFFGDVDAPPPVSLGKKQQLTSEALHWCHKNHPWLKKEKLTWAQS